MAIKLGATGITFQDNSVQTTAGGPVTTQYAIGSYVFGRPRDITNYDNSTVAGSSLYASFFPYLQGSDAEGGPFAGYGFWPNINVVGTGQQATTASSTLVNTGSWRCVSAAGGAGNTGAPGLWVRYA